MFDKTNIPNNKYIDLDLMLYLVKYFQNQDLTSQLNYLNKIRYDF